MKTFEFQFRWGGRRAGFGIDVNARTIEEAIAKANRFLASEEAVRPTQHPDAERLWINVVGTVTPRDIGSIYGPFEDPDCRNFTVAQWRREYERRCSLCHLPGLRESAHRHQGKWVCDERCWDDRLKASE
ncbi:MAG: hypothetical protein ACREIC_22100 [Limisphaerales bacterium]